MQPVVRGLGGRTRATAGSLPPHDQLASSAIFNLIALFFDDFGTLFFNRGCPFNLILPPPLPLFQPNSYGIACVPGQLNTHRLHMPLRNDLMGLNGLAQGWLKAGLLGPEPAQGWLAWP